MRSIASATITFGLVTLPVKIFTAAKAETPSFNMVTPKGNRVKQVITDAVTGEVVTHDQCSKGYEVAKDQFVLFAKDEFEALESKAPSKIVNIEKFVLASEIDLTFVETTYYLAPDKGGSKGYTLLAETLTATNRYAIAQWTNRGREHLVVVRPYQDGLIMQLLFYADEIRNFEELDIPKVEISTVERTMAEQLVTALSGTFNLSEYKNRYVDALQKLIDVKIASRDPGTSIICSDNILDLLSSLRSSLFQIEEQKAPPPPPKKARKSSKK